MDATQSGATHIDIYSDDTDVLVLVVRRAKMMTPHPRFISKTRTIDVDLLYDYLGSDISATLPAFHEISGADITGSFSRKGKLTCWAAFTSCPKSAIEAFKKLGTIQDHPNEDVISGIEKFVCKLFDRKINLETVDELRWVMFKKKQAHCEELPPTKSALIQAILRAHYQLIVWNNDIVANPELPSPLNFGWCLEDDKFCPVMTTNPPAPDAIMSLVKCKCSKSKCSKSSRSSSANANPPLPCTDLCECEDCTNNKTIKKDLFVMT